MPCKPETVRFTAGLQTHWRDSSKLEIRMRVSLLNLLPFQVFRVVMNGWSRRAALALLGYRYWGLDARSGSELAI
jgi:hypothetical protein